MLLEVRNRMHICGGGVRAAGLARGRSGIVVVTAKASADLGRSGAGMAFQNYLKWRQGAGPGTFTLTTHRGRLILGRRHDWVR